MPTIWVQVVVVYNSDNGSAYNMGVSSPNATAGGFNLASAGSPPNYPRGWKPRHIYGVSQDSNDSRHKLECASATGGIFQSGTTFTINYLIGSVNFAVQGKFAEKRIVKK